MRLTALSVRDVPPVSRFDAESLSDLIVIAGPNGVGKTRLIAAILDQFRHFRYQNMHFRIQATTKDEVDLWGKADLDTNDRADAAKLKSALQTNQRRRNFSSSIVYYESDRSIQSIKPLQFQWEFNDPWEEQIGWDIPFQPLKNRWQDTMHAIFKKIQSQKSAIANRAIQLKEQGKESMNLGFHDPIAPFKEAFHLLLGPKELMSIDVQGQTLKYSEGDRIDNVNSLSSGEREVLNIAFDFILRKPKDCIVFFDEPELHLHPELLIKLINTLRSVGERNQFVLVTHSPAMISSSLDDSVIFLSPPSESGQNQAVDIRFESETSKILHKLGQSIGIVALGKKIALIEGEETSLDKKTYGHILGNRFPGIVLQPVGGKDQLLNFDAVIDGILSETIWGVDFFMLADRDAVPLSVNDKEISEKTSGRFRLLPRYHLENYFLDERILAKCFEDQEPEDSWLRDEEKISVKLREIAIAYASYATALIVSKEIRNSVGNVDVLPKGCNGLNEQELAEKFLEKSSLEASRVKSVLDGSAIKKLVFDTHKKIKLSIASGEWKMIIPGKPILSTFSQKANIPLGRMKNLYLGKSKDVDFNVFEDIEIIFSDWHKQ